MLFTIDPYYGNLKLNPLTRTQGDSRVGLASTATSTIEASLVYSRDLGFRV